MAHFFASLTLFHLSSFFFSTGVSFKIFEYFDKLLTVSLLNSA